MLTTMQKPAHKLTLDFISDDGHGWLRISKAALRLLKIESEISPYSYQRGDLAYLEEDCDAPVCIRALKNWGFEAEFNEIYHKGLSPIRSYSRYMGPDWK